MLLGEIDIPEGLLTAQEEGRLVIFTGAGISMDSPSNLPSFLGLAHQVASKVGSSENPKSERWVSQLDAFMGFLNDDPSVDVHRLVKGIITDGGSLPNGNHEALAQIACQGTARVVTTNYDLHLERKMRDKLGESLEIYSSPALPLGGDFDGLVYLHGSGAGEARRLVVTDRDFSKAYFHSAWAARFLERMFNEYVVLFVGYSHSDVVMKYLGLGLGSQAERYVLTDKPDDQIWKRLQVRVLAYPRSQHHVLTACLAQWADLGEMGLLDHRQRIRSMVSGGYAGKAQEQEVLAPPAELSYLEESIRRPDRVRFFCEFAKDEQWLEWVRTKEPFAHLFNRAHLQDDVTGQLASWFAATFAFGMQEFSDRAWQTFTDGGAVLSTTLWNALAFEMHRYPGARPAFILRWLWVLLEQERPGCAADYLDFGLDWEGLWHDRELALALLEHLMTPRLVPEDGLWSRSARVETRGDLYWLDQAWSEKVLPDLDSMLFEVFAVVERSLRRHLALNGLTGHPPRFTRHRSAVSPETGNWYVHRDAMDMVIDSVRDCIERIWDAEPNVAQQVITRWVGSGDPLLLRLAVNAVGGAKALDADARVSFVLSNELTERVDCLREVCDLLASSATDASPSLIDDLLTAVEPADADQAALYRAFMVYESLESCGVANARLTDLLAEMRDVHGPEPYSNPGMAGDSLAIWGYGDPPISTSEFIAKVNQDPAEAVLFVLGFQESVSPSGRERTRAGALSMLGAAVEQHPAIGLSLWPHLADDPALQGAVVMRWGQVTDPDLMHEILSLLLKTDLKPLQVAVGQFLLHAVRTRDAHWEECALADDFIDHVWNACETQDTYTPGEEGDWYSESINVTVGHLLDYWFDVLHGRWTAAGEAWTGLPTRYRIFLDRALADHTKRGAHALTQITSRLHYLYIADTSWCRQALLPRGDWGCAEQAEPFWWGVLSHGRWNSGLASDGLVAGLLDTGHHLGAFAHDQRRRWAGLLASISVRCEAPSAETWVDAFTAQSGDDDRERWIDAVRIELADLDARGRSFTWGVWLLNYWDRRTKNDPVVFTQKEMDAFAGLAPLAPEEDFERAVALVIARPAAFDAHATAIRYVSDDLVNAQPGMVGRYLTHLMRNTKTKTQFWGAHQLRPLLEKLVALPGDWTDLKNAALGLGIDLDQP